MEEILKGLAQGGPLAVVAAWALWTITRELKALRSSIDGLHESIALLLDRKERTAP